jgi:hypothetical protein
LITTNYTPESSKNADCYRERQRLSSQNWLQGVFPQNTRAPRHQSNCNKPTISYCIFLSQCSIHLQKQNSQSSFTLNSLNHNNCNSVFNQWENGKICSLNLHQSQKLNDRLDDFFDVLHHWNFSVEDFDAATMKSTFKLYKANTNDIFKLFHDLLASLPHVHECHRRQWDVTSFVAAIATLSLTTYNTVQILKLETAIEAHQAKTELLTDISKLHEQHLHKLDSMIDDIGRELQVVKM